MNELTCKTFNTPREALAFMMGFHCAGCDGISTKIDPEENQTILADFTSNEADEQWHRLSRVFDNGVSAMVLSLLKSAQEHLEAGDPEEAVEFMDTALLVMRDGQSDERSAIGRARSEAGLGNPETAITLLEMALELYVIAP